MNPLRRPVSKFSQTGLCFNTKESWLLPGHFADTNKNRPSWSTIAVKITKIAKKWKYSIPPTFIEWKFFLFTYARSSSLRGAMIGIWLPSTAPTQLGKPAASLKPLVIFRCSYLFYLNLEKLTNETFSSRGKCIKYPAFAWSARVTRCKQWQTDACVIPSKSATVNWKDGMAIYESAANTCSSTDIAPLFFVGCAILIPHDITNKLDRNK